MKQKILLLVTFFISALAYGQTGYVWGDKFPFEKEETHPELVLIDNYNTYLLTVTNFDGILSTHKITVRKFDQKNQLLDTYTQDLKNIDDGTLYNYLGQKELSSTQVAVFATSYSGRGKIKNIYKYVFDKTTGKFTTSLIVSYPIESSGRSGDDVLRVSENGRYVGFIFEPAGRDNPENVIMLDGTTLATLWTKNVPLPEKTVDRAFTVTNSGKAVLLHAAKGWKLSNYLTVVSEAGPEDKQFEDAVMLHDPKAISIGSTDYLVDFDYDAKGLRNGDWEKIILYDLSSGKTIKNNRISTFNSMHDISDISFRKIVVQSDEIHLFAEAKNKMGMRPEKVTPYSDMTIDMPFYKFGPSYLIVMGIDGALKTTTPISTDYDATADLYHSFGVLMINGRYFINSGNSSGVYEMTTAGKSGPTYSIAAGLRDDPYNLESPHYVAQLFGYVKDAQRVILCRIHNKNQMSLVSITGFPMK